MFGPLQHVYCTAHGAYFSGPWVGESAQFGVRLTFHDDRPDRGAIYTPPIHGDVVRESGVLNGTNGILTKAWRARLGPTGSLTNCDDAMQVDFAEDLRTFVDAVKIYTANSFRWTHFKISPVGADGKAQANSSVYTLNTPVVGTATAMLPPQIAMAVSFRAPVLGRQGRGRLYLPAMSATIPDNGGTIQASVGTAVRAAAVTLLNNLDNPNGAPDWVPAFAITSAGADEAVRPTQVRTGNRFDTIRSRRQQVPETYTATDLS